MWKKTHRALNLALALVVAVATAPDTRASEEHHRRHEDGFGIGISIDVGELFKKKKKPPAAAKSPTKPKSVSTRRAKKQDKKPAANKKDPVVAKKDPPKDVDPPITEIDCVIYAQYEYDTDSATIANNADLKGSASALAAKTGAAITEVNHKSAKLPEALRAFTEKGKKCCKQIHIVSHGDGKGAMDLPYFLDLKDDTIADIGRKLGGPGASRASAGKFLDEFVAAAKDALCKAETSKLTFHGCWSGVEGGIAGQVAERGVRTAGYSGSCDHPQDVDTKEYFPPQPAKDTELKEFPAKKPDTPKVAEKKTKKK